jgi:pilus assembly protein Flp/PilA
MLSNLTSLVKTLRSDKRGVTALEYGLIASLIAVFIIGALTTLGDKLSSTFSTISQSL